MRRYRCERRNETRGYWSGGVPFDPASEALLLSGRYRRRGDGLERWIPGTIRNWNLRHRTTFYEKRHKFPRAKRVWDSILSRFRRRGNPPDHKHRRQIERQRRNNPTAGVITIAELEARVS